MRQFQTCVFFLLAIFGFFEGSFGDHQCTAVRGVCQLTTVACNNGAYTAGLCDGAVNRRCCVPYNDAACSSRGGNCRTDSLPCTGSYVSGLCGGPTNRRCCVPTPVVAATPAPSTGAGCSGVTIVSRAQWGARAPTSTATMRTPVSLVFIHHTAGGACTNSGVCVPANSTSYICNCTPDYMGTRCETKKSSCASGQKFPCPSDLVLFNYPNFDDTNCGSYYMCQYGTLTLMPCPATMKFNA